MRVSPSSTGKKTERVSRWNDIERNPYSTLCLLSIADFLCVINFPCPCRDSHFASRRLFLLSAYSGVAETIENNFHDDLHNFIHMLAFVSDIHDIEREGENWRAIIYDQDAWTFTKLKTSSFKYSTLEGVCLCLWCISRVFHGSRDREVSEITVRRWVGLQCRWAKFVSMFRLKVHAPMIKYDE